MAGAPTNCIIDLTNDSFTLDDHCSLASVVIDLEDYVRHSPLRNRTNVVPKRSMKRKKLVQQEVNILTTCLKVIHHNIQSSKVYFVMVS